MLNTSSYIYKELKRRKVRVELLNDDSALMRYRHNNQWHLLMGCVSEGTSRIASEICGNKAQSEYFARLAKLNVPSSCLYESEEQAIEFMKQFDSIVVKPLDAAHGNGISTRVKTKTDLRKAIAAVRRYSKRPALLQEMVTGSDVRIMVIDGKFVAAVRRVPPTVIGDGKHTVEKLIEMENENPMRTAGKRGRLKVISLEAARSFLKRHIGRVPKEGEIVPVSGVSNTSMGGHAEDATDEIEPAVRRQAERFAKLLNLPVCGIDIMLNDDGSYYFIEANSQPGFGPHHHPRVGKPRNVTKAFVDMVLAN